MQSKVRKIDFYYYKCPSCGNQYYLSIPLGKSIPMFVRCTCGKYCLYQGRKEVPVRLNSYVAYEVISEGYLSAILH